MQNTTENNAWLSLLFEEEIYLTDRSKIVSKFKQEDNNSVANESEIEYIKVEENMSDDLIFYGNNSSKIAVIVHYPDHEWIRPKDHTFLNNILLTLKSSTEQIALINIAKTNYKHIKDIIVKLPGTNFFIFGLSPSFHTGYVSEEISSFGSSKVIICSANLTDLAMDLNIKRIFWKNMKSVFGL